MSAWLKEAVTRQRQQSTGLALSSTLTGRAKSDMLA
jgi:hypothetical protein